MKITPELLRKHIDYLLEAEVTVKSHQRITKTGHISQVDQYQRELPGKTTNDPDYDKYKTLPSGTVVSKSKRGHVETLITSGQLKYRGRLRSGEALDVVNKVSNAKRSIEAHGLANVGSGTAGAELEWKDK